MHDDDTQHSKTKLKIAENAIFIGFILICIGIYRVFSPSKDTTIQTEAAPEMVSKTSAEINSADVPASLDREPQQFTEPNQINNETRIESEKDNVNVTNSPTEIINSKEDGLINNKSNVLLIYYAEVLNIDGSTQTIQLNAISEEKAREIIKDFRGNPEILQGPSLQPSWQVK